MIWQELTQPAVRDLAWACFSPPLLLSSQLPGADKPVGNCQLRLTPAREGRLRELDAEPGPLLAHLQSSGHSRLGLYFEALWHFFLETDPDTELLAHNLPVRAGGRTLGEFDIIYLCMHSGRHFHLELAVKFYLGLPHSDIWLGPGQRDRLDRKIDHLTGRQIRLGENPQARAQLRGLGVETLHRQIEVKGYLFQPESGSSALPAGFNPALPLSTWYPLDRFRALAHATPADTRWQLLPRQRWLSPPVPGNPPGPAAAADLPAQLRAKYTAGRGPQQLARRAENGGDAERCFVTPQSWPDLDSAL
jgi:hypothetical protein